MIGLDTGFFVELLKGNPVTISEWKKVANSEADSTVSSLSIFELRKLSLKGGLDADAVQITIEAILAACKVVWIDNVGVLDHAAVLSHGMGIPSMDAVILASLIHSGADAIYTTDRHMEKFKKKGIKIINLSKKG